MADDLRAALALLWLSHDAAGPRMNVNVCVHGLGLEDTRNPPDWLVEALHASR